MESSLFDEEGVASIRPRYEGRTGQEFISANIAQNLCGLSPQFYDGRAKIHPIVIVIKISLNR
jgi:hypothetical protein